MLGADHADDGLGRQMRRRSPPGETAESLSDQVDESLARRKAAKAKAPLDLSRGVISTGSTLLDLAISGGVHEFGGLPAAILVEIFGPSGTGKTVLLSEIAGAIQRLDGDVMFNDPENRLNFQFASLFGFDAARSIYSNPDTVTDLFSKIKGWEPRRPEKINGILADSLAALSTDMEMKDGDKYGMRRAKEFSEQLRTNCRLIAQRGYLMVCSNQVRQNPDAGPYAEKFKTPGGEGIGFYASVRLRCRPGEKIKRERAVGKSKESRVVGREMEVSVYKNSVDVPFREAPVRIVFDYGIDDVSANLDYLKRVEGTTMYCLGDERMGASLEAAASRVETAGLEGKLRQRVVDTWREVEAKFKVERQPRRRDV